MGAECLHDLPDTVELGRVERLFGVGVLVYEHGDDDGADRLVVGLAHRSADGLDDVHLGAARFDEGDTVEGWHIDAFGEAAGVREHTPLARTNVP